MADFVDSGWSYYVAIITALSIAACAWLLIAMSKRKVNADPKETTGHVWDETLGEYNNPLPRWWMGLFWITIIFSVIYLALYPGFGGSAGVYGWSSAAQYEQESAAANEQFGKLIEPFLRVSVEQVAKDPKALAIGERYFLNHCAQCHGSDGRGGKGFPNLTDSDWLYGGDPKTIEASILDGRHGVMPPMLPLVDGEEGVKDMANYVLALSKSPHDAAAAARGKEKFAVCAACHGADGKGNQTLGAPNLTDSVWLYGGSLATISESIRNGRENNMPAQRDFLGPAKVHLLAAYVYNLSQREGQKPTPAAAAGASAQ